MGMKVIKSRDFSSIDTGGVAIALGSFDGLHLGHQAVINKMIKQSRKMGLKSGVFTFYPHPLKILQPGDTPSSILSNRQKRALIGKMGVDYYLEQNFTKDFSKIDYLSFVKNVLINKLQVKSIVIGEDFRFGYKGKGSLKSLKMLGSEFNFSVTGIQTVKKDKIRISSTLIREMIKKGKINILPEFLGRYYALEGLVISGEGRGKRLGFPTANLKLNADYALPPRGVYANFVYCQGKKYKGITNFGFKPTFSSKNYTIEVYIINYSGEELYGKEITIELVDFIRKEMTFNNSAELSEQIRKDVLYTDSLLCYN